MSWAAPAYFWLSLLAVPLVALAAWGCNRRRQGMTRLIGAGDTVPAMLHPGRRARFARRVLLSAACLLLIVTLCRPQWGIIAENHQTQGVDILIALDTSRSMLADDLHPTRLAAAREAIAALTAKLRGDRIGLLAFAGSAFLVCPLTTDYGVFNGVLAETGVDTIPLGGTSLAAPLNEARRAFPGHEGGARVLILVSDGEDHGGDYAAAAKSLHDTGVTVYTVAAGTLQGGLIPLPQGEFFKDRRGVVVKSRLQPAPLQEIAAAAGGRKLDLAAGRTALADLYAGELAALERKDIWSVRQRLRERFQIPLTLALVLLAIEPFIGRWGKR
jgi:Ca-activated chloride channel family protein